MVLVTKHVLCIVVLAAVSVQGACAMVQQDATSVGQYEKLELTIPYLSFPDVPWDEWAFGYVEWCRDRDIVTGYDDGTYRPGEVVNRAQMAVYMGRSMAGGDAQVPTGPAVATFPDVPTDHWAFKYVEYLRRPGRGSWLS